VGSQILRWCRHRGDPEKDDIWRNAVNVGLKERRCQVRSVCEVWKETVFDEPREAGFGVALAEGDAWVALNAENELVVVDVEGVGRYAVVVIEFLACTHLLECALETGAARQQIR